MQVEVLEDAGRRRRWSAEAKARIIEESSQPGASVAIVARRYQVSRSLIYEWRRLARSGELGAEPAASFVPVEIEAPASRVAPAQEARRRLCAPRRRAGLIEIELGAGRRVRVDAQFDAEALRRVIEVLERG